MGTALSVFQISDIDNKFLKQKHIDTTHFQKKIINYMDIDERITPNIKLERKKFIKSCTLNDKELEIPNQVFFKVQHYSEIHKDHVRVFLDELEEPSELFIRYKNIKPNKIHEFENGYQILLFYDVIFNCEQGELYVFTTKDVSKQFVRNFHKLGAFNYEIKILNLEKIPEVPEIDNIFGAWEDVSLGRLRKKAYFGTDVHKSEGIEIKKVTSWNLEWSSKNSIVHDLFVNNECRLSSRSRINHDVLLSIYNRLKEKIGFKS